VEDQPTPGRLAHEDTMSEDGEITAKVRQLYMESKKSGNGFIADALCDQLAARRRAEHELLEMHKFLETDSSHNCNKCKWMWPEWQKAADEELK
jgi:hypothetical protein